MAAGMPFHIERWLQHIHALAGEIGPRGSTTDAERRAADYCEGALRETGLDPRLETFVSARSAFRPHLIVALGMLLSFGIYPLYGRASAGIAAALALVVIISEVLELTFRDNPLRRLAPRGESQNVVASLPPRGEHDQDLVLIGHLDSNRAALIFSTNRWVDFWRIAAPTIFFGFCAQTALYLVGTITQWGWVWPASTVSAVGAVVLAAICLQAEASPYSPGANDNASGAGLVLTLAERLTAEPLERTRVWFVNTGCEEVKHYGAIDFFERHAAELRRPAVLVFEMLGCDGPAWLEREVIIPPFAYRANPDLVARVRQLSAELPECAACRTTVLGGHTEMADALRLGIPALTLIGIGPEGVGLGYRGPELHWHRLGDTPDQIDPHALARNYTLIWALIRALDGAQGPACRR